MDASSQIDKQIAAIGDWRGDLYAKLRKLIHETAPEIKEEFKWGTGVFVSHGNVCAIGIFKDHVKLNFFQGAALADPHKLFNSGLEAKKTRTIDWHENDVVHEKELKELILLAVNHNG